MTIESDSNAKLSQPQCGIAPKSSPPAPQTASDPEWNTQQLFGDAREIALRHEGLLYRLRRTKLGKLILTK